MTSTAHRSHTNALGQFVVAIIVRQFSPMKINSYGCKTQRSIAIDEQASQVCILLLNDWLLFYFTNTLHLKVSCARTVFSIIIVSDN